MTTSMSASQQPSLPAQLSVWHSFFLSQPFQPLNPLLHWPDYPMSHLLHACRRLSLSPGAFLALLARLSKRLVTWKPSLTPRRHRLTGPLTLHRSSTTLLVQTQGPLSRVILWWGSNEDSSLFLHSSTSNRSRCPLVLDPHSLRRLGQARRLDEEGHRGTEDPGPRSWTAHRQ
jgi:hypothetical protein